MPSPVESEPQGRTSNLPWITAAIVTAVAAALPLVLFLVYLHYASRDIDSVFVSTLVTMLGVLVTGAFIFTTFRIDAQATAIAERKAAAIAEKAVAEAVENANDAVKNANRAASQARAAARAARVYVRNSQPRQITSRDDILRALRRRRGAMKPDIQDTDRDRRTEQDDER